MAEDRQLIAESFETADEAPLLELPIELLLHIFSFLSPTQLAAIAPVCKIFNKNSNDWTLWERFFTSGSRERRKKSWAEGLLLHKLNYSHHPRWRVPAFVASGNLGEKCVLWSFNSSMDSRDSVGLFLTADYQRDLSEQEKLNEIDQILIEDTNLTSDAQENLQDNYIRALIVYNKISTMQAITHSSPSLRNNSGIPVIQALFAAGLLTFEDIANPLLYPMPEEIAVRVSSIWPKNLPLRFHHNVSPELAAVATSALRNGSGCQAYIDAGLPKATAISIASNVPSACFLRFHPNTPHAMAAEVTAKTASEANILFAADLSQPLKICIVSTAPAGCYITLDADTPLEDILEIVEAGGENMVLMSTEDEEQLRKKAQQRGYRILNISNLPDEVKEAVQDRFAERCIGVVLSEDQIKNEETVSKKTLPEDDDLTTEEISPLVADFSDFIQAVKDGSPTIQSAGLGFFGFSARDTTTSSGVNLRNI